MYVKVNMWDNVMGMWICNGWDCGWWGRGGDVVGYINGVERLCR